LFPEASGCSEKSEPGRPSKKYLPLQNKKGREIFTSGIYIPSTSGGSGAEWIAHPACLLFAVSFDW